MNKLYENINSIISEYDIKKVDDVFYYVKLPLLCPFNNVPIVLGVVCDQNNYVITDNMSTVSNLEKFAKPNYNLIKKIALANHIEYADNTLSIISNEENFKFELNKLIAVIMSIYTCCF